MTNEPAPIDRLLAILQRGPTEEERHADELSFTSYRAWSAGVEWGAKHGRGEWDDAGRAWVEWSTNDDPEAPEETERLDQALIEEAGGEAMLRVRAHEIKRGDRGTSLDEVLRELNAEEPS